MAWVTDEHDNLVHIPGHKEIKAAKDKTHIKFKDVPLYGKFIAPNYLNVCEKISDSVALTEYGHTLFGSEDDVLYHGTADGLPLKRVIKELPAIDFKKLTESFTAINPNYESAVAIVVKAEETGQTKELNEYLLSEADNGRVERLRLLEEQKKNIPLCGKFISFEGIDGAGKTSHVSWLKELLTVRKIKVITTRELGGTPLGEKLRSMLLADQMVGNTEALLAFASRSEHVCSVILPALSAGTTVISDRFTDSSFAFQGGGRSVSIDLLNTLEQYTVVIKPDITFLFDLSIEKATERMSNSSEEKDRIEKEANDAEIQAIRINLEAILKLAKDGKLDALPVKATELKSSFVKVYLKRG